MILPDGIGKSRLGVGFIAEALVVSRRRTAPGPEYDNPDQGDPNPQVH